MLTIESEKLNLVVPIDHASGKTYYLHVAPLMREVFEQHFEVLGATFDAIYMGSLGITGPRLAELVLKKVAARLGVMAEVEAGLIPEMHRGAHVLAPGETGAYETIPWHEAVARNLFSEEDAREASGCLTFFIVASSLSKKSQRKNLYDLAHGLWQAQASSLGPTQYAASLRISITEEPTAAKVARSSIPV